MIAKLIVHGVDREHARRRMLRALDEFEIGGITTLLGFHRALLDASVLRRGRDVPRRRRVGGAGGARERAVENEASAPARAGRVGARRAGCTTVELDGRRFEVDGARAGAALRRAARRRRRERSPAAGTAGAKDAVVSPMQGTVLAVEVAEGDEVEAGQVICIVEAMKMENEIARPSRRASSPSSRSRRVRPVTQRPGDLRRRSSRTAETTRLQTSIRAPWISTSTRARSSSARFGIPVSEGRLATTPRRRGPPPRSSAARSSSRRRC